VLLLADPFTFPADSFLERLNQEQPGLPVVGGMVSGALEPGRHRLLSGTDVLDGGAAGVALVGPVDIRAVVSQGCRPVGSPFAVTRGEGNIVHELGGRPAVDRLRQLLASLDRHEQELLRGGGLQVGQVIDEHKASFDRGDFLVRGLLGADPETGSIAVADSVEVGQTLQFHVRDADAADEDLELLLTPCPAGGPGASCCSPATAGAAASSANPTTTPPGWPPPPTRRRWPASSPRASWARSAAGTSCTPSPPAWRCSASPATRCRRWTGPPRPPPTTPPPARRPRARLGAAADDRPRRPPAPLQPPEVPAQRGRLAVPAGAVHPRGHRPGAGPRRGHGHLLRRRPRGHPHRGPDGRSTEELAARSGPGIGGFLNVTFGNAPELIIALFALAEGLQEVVKASIVGSILGNILLVMGAAMLVGGLRRERQLFDRTAANVQSGMLLLAAVALVMPAIFELVAGAGLPRPTDEALDFPGDLERLSVGGRVVLLATYAAGLVFSLRTHRDLFNPSHDEADHGGGPWSVRRAVTMLAIAGVAVGVMSEILVGSITEASENLGLSPFFVGIIVVAIVGNAAEHWVAVYFAMRDKMDLSVNIAIGSSAQIALFVAPVLVLLSFLVGPFPMALVFNGFEIGAIFLAILVANQVTQEGESTWFEGLQLLAVYAVLGLTFYFVT
jgi:Ca2+:H+ antiporter